MTWGKQKYDEAHVGTAAAGRKQDRKQERRIRPGALEMPLVCLVCAGGLAFTWQQRAEGHLTAEYGLGYWLGILGSVLMLALLLYPLRKRLSVLRFIGGVRSWFRIHMLLGVVGPAIILVHANFSLGSLNSSLALACMLIVAISGFVGRFLYGRIHRGLYGRRAQAMDFLSDVGAVRLSLDPEHPAEAGIAAELASYETRRLQLSPRLMSSLWVRLTSSPARNRMLRKSLGLFRDITKERAKAEGWSRSERRSRNAEFERQMVRYFDAVTRAESFRLYERLFSFWHLMHLPLFLILVFAALAHVVAVHLY
ncbi:MAG: pyridine nucleotide-disulfide oxidoreductase [Rhodobacteraceae bacterium]|nr:pyridine nucleotide-disulfide oxidoreductase [Paracoccaceae bacterium]